MANFINSFDPQELPPPFHFPDVSMTAFVLDLGMEFGLPGLTRYCDTFLGVDPDVHYRPLTPIGYLCVLDYPKMYCDAPGYEKWGYVPQKEVFFTFPAVRFGKALGNIYLPTELSWAMPFIAVNNPTSAVTGRTVLGFQKLCGEIDIAEGADGSFGARVSLPTFLTLGRNVAQQYEPIVSVRTGPPNPDVDAVEHHFPWSFMGHNQAMDAIETTSMHLLETLIPGLLAVINLKQMRGAQNPNTAVYQALVQSRMTFENMTAPTFYRDPEFMFHKNGNISRFKSSQYGPQNASNSPIGPPVGVPAAGGATYTSRTSSSTISALKLKAASAGRYLPLSMASSGPLIPRSMLAFLWNMNSGSR